LVFFEGGTILGSPDEVLDLGDTEVTRDVFMDFLSGIEQQNFRFVTITPEGRGGGEPRISSDGKD